MKTPSGSLTTALFPLLAVLFTSPACTTQPALDVDRDAAGMGAPEQEGGVPPPDAAPALEAGAAIALDAAASLDAEAPADAFARETDPTAEPETPVSTEVVPGPWRQPAYCHDLAPAAGSIPNISFADVCPSASELHGGPIRDGIYREVRREICLSPPGGSRTKPVRIRISGAGTLLDWSAEAPIFSARLRTEGTALEVTETCRRVTGDRPQPPYVDRFSVSGDQLTIYSVLASLVFRREP
jgi:hypothetical protein